MTNLVIPINPEEISNWAQRFADQLPEEFHEMQWHEMSAGLVMFLLAMLEEHQAIDKERNKAFIRETIKRLEEKLK